MKTIINFKNEVSNKLNNVQAWGELETVDILVPHNESDFEGFIEHLDSLNGIIWWEVDNENIRITLDKEAFDLSEY